MVRPRPTSASDAPKIPSPLDVAPVTASQPGVEPLPRSWVVPSTTGAAVVGAAIEVAPATEEGVVFVTRTAAVVGVAVVAGARVVGARVVGANVVGAVVDVAQEPAYC